MIELEPEKDPEIVLLRMNSSFKKGRQARVVIAQGESKQGDLTLAKSDDPKVKGYIRESLVLDSSILLNGFEKFEKNIESHSKRLNLHSCYLKYAVSVKFYDRVDSGLSFFMKTSKEINNEWRTLYGEKVKSPEESLARQSRLLLMK